MLADEKLVPLSEIARSLPPGRNGKRCHFSTVWRWVLTGARGPNGERIRLEAIRCGSRWLSSKEALGRFIQKLTPTFVESIPSSRTPTQRRRASDRAAAELREKGVI